MDSNHRNRDSQLDILGQVEVGRKPPDDHQDGYGNHCGQHHQQARLQAWLGEQDRSDYPPRFIDMDDIQGWRDDPF